MRSSMRGSTAVRGVVATIELLQSGSASRSSVVITRLIPGIWRYEPDRIVTLADRSRLLQTVERFFKRSMKACEESATKARLKEVLHPSVETAPVRLAGWMGFCAATTHVWLLGIDATGLGWVAAVPFTLACISRPEAILAAWKTSRFLRSRPDLPTS